MTIDIEKLADDWAYMKDSDCGYAFSFAALKQFAEAYAAKVLEDKEREIDELKDKHNMQLAGISTASIGYFKDGDDIHPEYDTVALRDVTKLYSKYDALFKQNTELKDKNSELSASINDLREALGEYVNNDPVDIELNLRKQQAVSLITKTPAQSLQEHDNELLEQVISTIESMNIDAMFKPVSFSDMYVAIRALKQEVK